MATITNYNTTLMVNNTIYQKDDLGVTKEAESIIFNDGFTKLSIKYAEFSSPSSTDIDDLISTINNYINEVSGVGGAISADNSTTTLLNASSTFTGVWVDASAYSSVIIATKTDQNGKIYVDFSPDGVNADSTLTRYYRTDQIEPPHRFTITRKYLRVRFENTSASNQTFIRLQTMLGNQTDLNSPADSTLSQDFDAQNVRPTDFNYETALGLRQGRSTVNKFGYNSDVDTGSEEIVASFGGTFNIMTSSDTLNVVSDSLNDDVGGSGATSILISGIDGNYLEQSEVVTMDGTTPVTTTNQWLGVNRVVVLSSGVLNYNGGTITVTDTSSTFGTQAIIPAAVSVTQQCIYHTQINHSLLLNYISINAVKVTGGGGNPEIIIRGYSYSRVTETDYQVFKKTIDVSIVNDLEIIFPQPLIFTGREVIYFTAETDTNNTEVAMRFSGIEFKEADA